MPKSGYLSTALILLVSMQTALSASSSSSASSTATATATNRLLRDDEVASIAAEISGLIAKDTVIELSRNHRVQASPGFTRAAEYIAAKAREYGLQQVAIERFPADGKKTYYTLKSAVGWEAASGRLTEVAPGKQVIADYAEMSVALADYSQTADVKASLVDVGFGTSESDYKGQDVKGKIVLAGGSVAEVHRMACDERGAAGILSYQPNQVTGWSGDYVDNVRWGHLSPYNPGNKFAFMTSLRVARQYRDRLARGEQITLQATVQAEMRPANYEVVTAVIPGTDLAGEEIVFSCHLCHQKPGANDNASGAAAILEAARALSALIRRHAIEPPRRTIRFVWPPEISGTLAYFAEHPEIVRRMKAAVHCDMVGGNYSITKSVLHLTHTPASLPSCVNAVGDIFTEYAIAASLRGAMDGALDGALISPGGSKDSLVADITPYEMGSDHDVYEEGSFRVPTIYLRDWPDVFIHTNNDSPANIDPTKMKRSTFIAAASGYFLAHAGAAEAAALADEVFARALASVPLEYAKAMAAGREGSQGSDEARNIIGGSVEIDQEALSSVLVFAPNDKALESKVEGLVDQLSGAWLVLTGKLSQQRKGKKTLLVLEPKELVTGEGSAHGAREAATSRSSAGLKLVPRRKVTGPMNVYYYDYVVDHAKEDDLGVVQQIKGMKNGEIILYEILNLVDGQRSVQAIRDYVAAAYGPIPVEDVYGYIRLLSKIGVVQLAEK
jgi:aminopeptidase YwaD